MPRRPGTNRLTARRPVRRRLLSAWAPGLLLPVVLSGAQPFAAEETGYQPAPAPALAACAGDAGNAVPVTYAPGDDVFLSADGTRYVAVDLRQSGEAGPGNPAGVSARAVPLGPPDRWERVPSWIVVEDGSGRARLWQAQLLEKGLALFAPGQADAECALALRRAEARGRRAGAGFWRNRGDGVIYSAARPGSFIDAAGRYVIVRGRIVSLGKTRGTRYLNFGKYWKTDVTGTLKSADEEAFNAALGRSGRSLDTLSGAFVELRGIVEDRDGPHIALRHPEQLVVLDD